MDKDKLKEYIINVILEDDMLAELIGKDRIVLWKDFFDYKVGKIVETLGNMEGDVLDKVISSWLIRIRKFVVEVDRAVRDNYSLGENAVLKALIKVFKNGV